MEAKAGGSKESFRRERLLSKTVRRESDSVERISRTAFWT